MGKRVSIFLLAMLLLVSLSSASLGESSEEAVTLTFATWANEPVIFEFNEGFMAENPGVTVEMAMLPGDQVLQLIETRCLADDAPDVFMYFGDRCMKMPENGWWGELDNESWTNDLTDAARSAVTYTDGVVYAFPPCASSGGVFYNKSVFADLGLVEPKNWAELMEICETLKANGIAPFTIGGRDVWPITDMFWQFGFSFASPADPDFGMKLYDGETTIAESSYRVAIERYAEVIEKGYMIEGALGKTFSDSMRDFALGDAAMLIEGSFVVGQALLANEDLETGYFPLWNDEGKAALTFGVDKVLGYYPNGKNVELAKKFIAYYVANNDKYLNETLMLPTLNNMTPDLPESLLTLSAYLNELPIVAAPYGFWPQSTQDALLKGLSGFYAGQCDIDECLAEMDKTFLQDKGQVSRPDRPY